MSYVSRTGRKAKSTIVETAAFGGIGGRKRATVNARQADNLLKCRAPDIGPKPHWLRSVPVINHDRGDGNLQLSEVFDQNSDHISEAPLVNILFKKKRLRIGESKRLSENWRETEHILTEILHQGVSSRICTCTHKD
ncbi:hypothetical protein BDD12DRAFT_876813 [Trichophaea hybrida]|nr:hypothetical protein BDD12DRAFT_876813 [Trichophaea hybrida]